MSTDTLAATLAKPGKYLAFGLGGGEYGLEILKVQEVLGIVDVTPVPRTPTYLRGVINLRGRVIPVVELRRKYGMPSVADTGNTCIIVVQVTRGDLAVTMGLIVDEVSEVLSFTQDQIEVAPDFGGGRHEADSITGVGKLGRKAVILLDADRVLTVEELEAVAKSEGKEVPR